ncbi:MAG: YaiI/YqxD family protein [Rickettsiales bacterium]|nr:YaiI/YqxD family protein [Rickettsiales bacterium]
MPIIYVDADACPVKQEISRVAERFGLTVYMVSNSGTYTAGRANVHSIMVSDGFDAADDWIAEKAAPNDIVITNDIPLAARALEKGAHALAPNGRAFTKESIGTALAMREFNAYLRETGESKGHNASFSKQDRSNFLQALDQLARKLCD